MKIIIKKNLKSFYKNLIIQNGKILQ